MPHPVILIGHHAHTHSSPTDVGGEDDSRSDQHRGHAHERQHSSSKKHGIDLNILGIFVHILGDAVNSIAVSEYQRYLAGYRVHVDWCSNT